ncbi:MAG: nucleotide sugar dehydrogenase, partial [Alphaproteobacteria bacterium]
MTEDHAAALLAKIEAKTARVGVIGLGYVGLPLALTAAEQGFPVTGFDIDPEKIARLDAGESYIDAAPADRVGAAAAAGRLDWTADYGRLAAIDVVVICVPTPLTRHREPDLSYVVGTARSVAREVKAGALVVLESTSYPGTTEEALLPELAESGLAVGRELFVGYSPEREDPGNASFRTATIPKIVAGVDAPSARLVEAFYRGVVDRVVPVSTTRAAEAVKITENIFRAVNIALVNELKVIYDAMDVDVWEVIEAAATKPFGYMPFYPGPGLGGHCIPIDPFYLTWKAREHELSTRFIELAGEINVAMPRYVLRRLRETLDRRAGKGLAGA